MSNMVHEKFGFSTPFLRGYKTLRIPIMDADGTPAWPDLFPPPRIQALRDSVGPRHFSAQMMLTFVPPDRARLDPDALHLYDDDFDAHTARIADNIITGACVYWDPSTGRAKRDGSVCVLLYRDDKNHHMFIHDILYLRASDNELHPLAHQCADVLTFMRRHNMRRIVIETNGVGNALPEIMRDVSARAGIPIAINGITNSRNKTDRILDAIEPVLNTGRLHARRCITASPLIAEMLGWVPTGNSTAVHDDGIDAVAGALSTAPTPIHPLGRATHPYSANTNFKI